MKRIVLSVFLCSVIAVSVSACRRGEPAGQSASPSAPTGELQVHTPEDRTDPAEKTPPSEINETAVPTQIPQTPPAESPAGSTENAGNTGSETDPAAKTPDRSPSAPAGTTAPVTAPGSATPGKPTPESPTPGNPTPGKTSPGTQTPPQTQAPTPTPSASPSPEQQGPLSAAHVKFSDLAGTGIFTGANLVRYSVTKDENEGWIVTISTTRASSDPYISFHYSAFLQKYGLTAVDAADYPYVVFRVKTENCSNSTFELFFTTGDSPQITSANSVTTIFDNDSPEWQYIIFDCSKREGWKSAVRSFRLDFMQSAAGAGETLSLSDVIFAKSLSEAQEIAGYAESAGSVIPEEEQERADAFLAGAKDPAPDIVNQKETAEYEDETLDLWFNHTYTRTPAESTASTGQYTYLMRLARNEIEACQFLLASTGNQNGLTAAISDFTDDEGNVLRGQLFYGYYFSEATEPGRSVADPIPPLTGPFNLPANRSKTFLIKVYATDSTPAGLYSAVLTIRNSAGQEVKRATVYALVWNFTLPEKSSCKTLTDLSFWNIYASHGALDSRFYSGDDSVLYSRYYDYLLENRINAYTLPYDTKGAFSDSRIEKYLNDPRVQAFNPIGWKTELTAENTASAYRYLKQSARWLEKAYFYTVDEPENQAALDQVIADAQIMEEHFPGYRLIVPMHLNSALGTDGSIDYFEYLKDYVNVWCPHTFFFNTFAEYRANPLLTYRVTTRIESVLGTFPNRMAREQAGGDEVWWYVTRYPNSPEITLTLETQAVKYRILFWQQKLYRVDGFLYYCVNDWRGMQSGAPEDNYGWNPKHEVEEGGITPFNVYGNGVLLYNGGVVGIEGPVGSLRLECVRDGIEDFEYLTMLDQLYGEGTAELVIRQLTTSLGEYKADEEFFTSLRTAVGNLIAEKTEYGNI